MDDAELKTFSVWDYLVFSLVLVISASIGIFYGCTGGKQKTTGEFLMANRQMPVLPVAMSLLASFMSAITLLGTPAEIYVFGTVYWWIWLGYLFLIPFSAHVFLPLFFRLRLTSVYEYLEMRFKSRSIRMSVAIIFSVQMALYMAIVLYAPSLALSQVTGLNVWITVCTVGIVCTFYTSIGGMKAVMWTDTFQICMMFAGLFAVLIKGSIDAGGFANIWKDNMERGRIDLNDFDPDPLKRHTFWTLSVGGFFTWLAVYGVNQAQVQRALCVPKLRHAQIALWVNLPGLTALLTVCGLCGLVVFSRYKDCDPLRWPVDKPYVSKKDQLLPFYVMDNLADIPGLPGLFTACLFSGALSTISSGLNSLSAVFLQDIIKTTRWPNITEQRATLVTKIVAFCYGLLCIALTFVASQMGGVLQAALALFGVLGGPQLGVFMLAVLFPFANWIGALAGLFVSLAVTFWVMVGNFVTKPYLPTLPTTIAGCNMTVNGSLDTTPWPMSSLTQTTLVPATPPPLTGLEHFYELSYLHYGTIAVVIGVVVGVVVSLLTGRMTPEEVDPKLINSPWDVCCFWLPRGVRDVLRFHVKLYEPDDDDEGAVDDIGEIPAKQLPENHTSRPPPYDKSETLPCEDGSPAVTENGVANPAYDVHKPSTPTIIIDNTRL